MTIHSINILIHVVAGTLAMLIGASAIAFYNNTRIHRRLGKTFVYLLSIVVVSGAIGWVFFRSDPFLLMLTLISGYTGFSGRRNIKLRTKRSTGWDATVAIVVLTSTILYFLWLRQSGGTWAPTVIYSTVGALVFVTGYDLLKYIWLHKYISNWWLYEHIYKMISAFAATLSAFMGTVFSGFKPYSQVGPSALCILIIVVMIWKQAAARRTTSRKTSQSPALYNTAKTPATH